METEKKICGICLKVCDHFKAIEGDMKDILDIVLPKMDIDSIQKPVMCTNCTEMLIKCLHFKAACFFTHDYLVPILNKDNVKLNLKDVYLMKNGDTCILEDRDICGFCMKPVKSCSAISFNVNEGDVLLKKMIERCLPELNLNIINKPVICAPCHCSLEICFCFVTSYLTVEEEIKKYCETLDLSSKSQIELSSVLQFASRDVVESEVDGNSLDNFKVEEQFCEDREYAEERKMLKDDIFKLEQMACEEGDPVKIEDQKFLVNEEIDIKTDEQDINRFEDGVVVLPQPRVTTSLRTRRTCLMPILEGNLLNLYIKCTRTNLLVHKNPSKLAMYYCDSCTYQSRRKCDLEKHIVVHKDPSEVTMHKCDTCSFQTKWKEALMRHVLVHKELSEFTMYKCGSCSFQAKRKGALKQHILARQKCGLKRHILVHKGPTVYKCNTCSYQTIYKGSLANHLLVHEDPSEITMYKCASCSFQTKRKDTLKTHLNVHKDPSEITMYKCAFCSFQTKRQRYLKTHLNVHKDPSEITIYKCASCSFRTKRKVGLSKHLHVHQDPSEITWYKCASCSYQTKRKDTLKTHLNIHKDPSEITMYKCSSCSFQTKRKDTLKKHLNLHKDPSEITMYKCASCSFQTKWKTTLKTHLLRVHKVPSELTLHK